MKENIPEFNESKARAAFLRAKENMTPNQISEAYAKDSTQLDSGSNNSKDFNESKAKAAFKKLSSKESWGKSMLRTLYQIPSGIAKRVTYPADIAQMIGVGDALDSEDIDNLRRISEREGIPFDEEAYMQAVQQAADSFPTQGNIERMVEEETGAPLQAKTGLQKGLKLASTAASFTPGSLSQKGVAAASAPAISTGLEHVGVPEAIAEPIALVGAGFAGSKAPNVSISKATKPSGLTTRKYEDLKKPTKISESKAAKINEKVEGEFRTLADKIVENSPSKDISNALKSNPLLKEETGEMFQKVKKLSENIPSQFPTAVIKKELADTFANRKGTGFTPSDYDKTYQSTLQQFIKDTKPQNLKASDLVDQYRSNNKSLREYYEPGKSGAMNRAKKDAYLDYNRSIAKVIDEKFPNSEFSRLFKESNKQQTQILDTETINKFVDEMFDGKIKFDKAKSLFEKEGMKEPFKRALGDQGFKDFKQLTSDLLTTESANKLLKVAKTRGYDSLEKTFGSYFLHPAVAASRLGVGAAKSAGKGIYQLMLDNPKLITKWEKGLKSFKASDFKAASAAFEDLEKARQELENSSR